MPRVPLSRNPVSACLSRRRAAALLAGCALQVAAPPAARAQHASAAPLPPRRVPTRTVRLIVPFAAAQGSDLLARTLGAGLGAVWGQTVVVENRPGANGSLAVQELLRSAPDGHTLLVSSNAPIVINPNLYRRLAYRPATDLVPLLPLAAATLALVVNPSLGVSSLAELVAWLKSKPGPHSYGSPGLGSTSHMAAALFAQAAGVELVHVPYKGSGAALTDLIGGQLSLMVDALPSCLQHVHSGRLRALAVTGESRSSYLPAVPTCASLGLPGLPAGGWYGVFAPARLGAAAADQMARDLAGAIAQPAFHARLQEQAFDPLLLDAPGFARLVRDDTAYWERTTRRLHLFQQE